MNKTVKRIIIGTSIVFGLAIIGGGVYLYLVFRALDSLGPCGFDDGPFTAVVVDDVGLSDTLQTFDLANSGKLILNNRNDTLSPLLTLVENGKTVWTLDTDVRNTKGFETCRIWEISRLTVTKDTDPIKLTFLGHWTYGAERGAMEIDRETGDNSFCLSW
jgi:hypothetical protein